MPQANINLDPDVALSQKRQVLLLLQAGEVLTPKKAEEMVGTTKVSTRISELILKDGHTEIVKEYVKVAAPKTKKGWTRVMSYRIPPEKRQSA